MKKRERRKGETQELAESAEQVREKIRKLAYEFFEFRGKRIGRDLDDWLKAESGHSAPAEHGPARQSDVKHSLADLSRAEQYLGYRPTVSFEENLRRTVGWYRVAAMRRREPLVGG